MRLAAIPFALLLAAGPLVAQAQPAPNHAMHGAHHGYENRATILSLSETAEREVTPDLLRARFAAEASADSPAKAQGQVNAALEKAVAKLKAAGLAVATGGYNTWEDQPRGNDGKPTGPARWRANAQLTVSSKDSSKLLEAAGSLQQDGLLMQGLGFEVSRELRRSLEDELTKEALARLKIRAELAATALGQSFDGWQQVRVGSGPMPQPRMMQMAMSAKAMAAPVAEPGSQTISLSVDGDARLK